jgi:hypothetical protein
MPAPSFDRLNEVLAPRLGAARVTSLREEAIGTGQMSESRRLRLEYTQPCDLPTTMIAKFPSDDPTSRATGKATRCYEVEASFYRDLRDALDVGAPHCYFVERDDNTDEFLLLLEDFAPCHQGDQIAGCSVSEARACIDELVRLHGPLWNSPFLATLPWLNRSTPEQRTASYGLLRMVYDGFNQRYRDRLTPEARMIGDEFARDPGSYSSRIPQNTTVVHADYRLDNLLFMEDGRIGVVDFQTVTHASGALDLAYFIGAGLVTDVRREHERDLVRQWIDGLRGYGVELVFDDAWHEYRRFAFAGFMMAVIASMIVKQTPRGDEMFLAMANRHAQHAVDLESLAAVRN